MNNVRDFGAIGNGISKDTAAIQKAIDAGGIAYFPPGVYLSGTIYLRSNGGLDLAPGAVLLGSPDPEDYNAADFCPQNRASVNEIASGAHLITAIEQENIVIRGGGRIDANSPAWFAEMPMNPHSPIVYQRPPWRPSQTIFLCECKNLWIQNVELANAAYWSCFLHGCENATLSRLHIHSDHRVINDDGIDLDCCSKVTVSDCIIDTGDDGITLRGNSEPLKQKRACEYITVTNCVLRSGYANAIRIGVGSGIVRHSVFNNIVVYDTRTAICVVSKYSDREGVNGTTISDLAFRNLHVDVFRFLNLKLDNTSTPKFPTPTTMERLVFSQITGRVELSTFVHGNGQGIIRDVTFADMRLCQGGVGPAPDRHPRGRWGCASTDAAFDLRHARDIAFERVRIDWENNGAGWTSEVKAENATFTAAPTCHFPKMQATAKA
ncbi:MAG TPA: glycosyl hydrolase family 28-related protein, partial [Lentisphaeria bacterium]|nr:glycosyl hydrolase family 28-related protein [Lentisphaeria bacterium]